MVHRKHLPYSLLRTKQTARQRSRNHGAMVAVHQIGVRKRLAGPEIEIEHPEKSRIGHLALNRHARLAVGQQHLSIPIAPESRHRLCTLHGIKPFFHRP